MQLPRTLDDLTAEWLSWALSNGPAHGELEPSAIVGVHAQLLPQQGAYGQLARVQIDYANARSPGPRTLIAKLSSPDAQMRERENTKAAYEREVRFYLELAPAMSLSVPRCYFASIDSTTGWHTILLEDLAPISASAPALTAAQAQEAIDAITRLHVHWWASPRLSQLDWIAGRIPPPDDQIESAQESFWNQFQDRVGKMNATVKQIGDELGPKIGSLLRHIDRPEVQTLVHGDLSIGNLLFREGESPRLHIVDWQLIKKSSGIWDVAWLLAQHLEPHVRSDIERLIIRRYVQTVTESNIGDYPIDVAERDYRAAILARFPTIITSVVALPLSEEVKTHIISTTFPRLCEALLDNQCLEHLREMS